jgi:L-alanine-DL-glutamate epimerase-like enolase superfamily enzyme
MQMKIEDFRSDTWKRLTQTLEERLEDLRQLNDNPSLGVEQTALIRGGIKELKKILDLAEQASSGPLVSPDELSAGSPDQ